MNILRLPFAVKKIGLSKSAIYGRIKKEPKHYDETFPKPISLGSGRTSPIAFIESEIDDWINLQLQRRNAA